MISQFEEKNITGSKDINIRNTVINAIKNISGKLSENNIPDARLNAELFLCHVLNCDR
ncbi:MAG: hypothetical protein KDD00_12450, partial [Ignavibacteriae bacterium]|nr:hypothetical protein [Ignavibacteriota bacterium]